MYLLSSSVAGNAMSAVGFSEFRSRPSKACDVQRRALARCIADNVAMATGVASLGMMTPREPLPVQLRRCGPRLSPRQQRRVAAGPRTAPHTLRPPPAPPPLPPTMGDGGPRTAPLTPRMPRPRSRRRRRVMAGPRTAPLTLRPPPPPPPPPPTTAGGGGSPDRAANAMLVRPLAWRLPPAALPGHWRAVARDGGLCQTIAEA